jgi:hypothetical protein
MTTKKYWRIIFALIILEIVTIAAILIIQKVENRPDQNEQGDVLTSKNVQVINWPESMIIKNVKENLPDNYDVAYTKTTLEDLDNDGQAEIMACSVPSLPADEGKIFILKPLTLEGKYKKIAEVSLSDMNFNRELCGEIPPVTSTIDFDKDGIKELVLGLGTAGAYTDSFGIFQIDSKNQKINWTKIVREDGRQENIILLNGSSLLHQNTFEAKNLTGNNQMSIIEKTADFKGDDLSDEKWQNSKNWQWNAEVYRWDNGMFIYDKKLSENYLIQ